ncbi:MAG: helix-turn-helix domain-containing protein [Tetragenococcus sp.]|nr:helix-turn-helix domain-containing protein [Tetragenococcus sp.]MDN6836340.1 helix-turn-helix domain-containing protein [Lactococcus lactis]
MATQEQIDARKHILSLIDEDGWDHNKETLEEVQNLAEVLVPDLHKDKDKIKTQEQQEREEARYHRDQVIVSLADEGYSYKRIVDLMSCSPSTVRKAINDWSVECGT